MEISKYQPTHHRKIMSEQNDIERALKMAEEYAAFAPGKIFHTDPETRGNETAGMLTTLFAKAHFLFPQLGGVDMVRIASLIKASEEAGATLPGQGSKENGNRQVDLRAIHKLRWNEYAKSGINNSLLPFQIELIKACFAYRWE
jgi:hypothetical protein